MNYLKKHILPLLLLFVLFSCRKEVAIEECSQNCATYNIKGKFYDAVNNVGFSNIPVELKWNYFRYCISCPRSRQVYSGRSDENGNFDFSINIDTTFFNDYSLELTAPKISNYFDLFSRSIYRNDLQNDSIIKVGYYPIGNLKLNLHRIETDSIIKMSISHIWKGIGTDEYINQLDYFGESPNLIIDSSFNIETVADLSTKIVIKIFKFNGNQTEIVDSIVCNRSATSILNMNY